MTALCSAPISLQAVMTCYTLNAQRKNDNNLLLLVEFLQRLPRVLALLGENEGFMPKLLSYVQSPSVEQSSGLDLLCAMCGRTEEMTRSCKQMPNLKQFAETYRLASVIRSIPRNKANSKSLNALLVLLSCPVS